MPASCTHSEALLLVLLMTVVLGASAGAQDRFPSLTPEMVDKGVRLFEWLLDAKLTDEQYQQFKESLERSWKTQNKDEITGTLDVLKFYDDLGRRSEAERNAVRESLQGKYLEAMRQMPGSVLAQWVLAIYYSAHTPIAVGNPPLTRQVADAYAEVNCFIISEVVGGEAFKPGKEFKDKLANSLIAGYATLNAERQKALSQLPMMWAAIRLGWPQLSEAERASYRHQWTPGVREMLGPPAAPQAAAVANAPRRQSSDSRTAIEKLQNRMAVDRMLFNMNQDYIHRYVLRSGWSYTKYAW